MKLLLSSSEARQLKSLFSVLWLLLSWSAPAAQVKLDSLGVCGRSYTNVTVVGFNTTDLYFTHPGGMNNVKLKYLESTMQKRFDYDPAAAAEAEKQQAAAEVRYQESVASNLVVRARQAALAAQRAAATSEDSLADPVSKSSLIGKAAPAMEGGKWLGEKPELRGKLVLVAFWAPWSIPCRKCMPTLAGLEKKFAGKLAVVGVTSESEAEVADMPEPGIAFTSMLDPEAKLRDAVGVTSIPYVMLVDAKGLVRYQGHPTAITEQQLEGILAKATE